MSGKNDVGRWRGGHLGITLLKCASIDRQVRYVTLRTTVAWQTLLGACDLITRVVAIARVLGHAVRVAARVVPVIIAIAGDLYRKPVVE